MKISKLFHWLYAILMLLPAFFVGGRMAYTIFNKNAKDSYSYEKNLSQVVDITNTTNLIDGNTYYFSLLSNEKTQISGINTGIISYYETNLFDVLHPYVPLDETQYNQFSLGFLSGYWNWNTLALYKDNTVIQYYVVGQDATSYINKDVLHNIWFTFKDRTTSQTTVPNVWHMYENIYGLSGSLDNAFDYSMSQLNELPLFSWAKDSFIVEPFTYITGLFGMPSDSPVLTLLSYWCSISLIWLTFDLLMYVPLLVHRWIDKGVLE